MEFDGLPSTFMLWPAVTYIFWPNEYDPGQIYTWPNFAGISSNIYEDIIFHPVFGSLIAVTLTFDLWPQNLISTPASPNTSVTKIGWNSLHWLYPNVTTLRSGLCYRKYVVCLYVMFVQGIDAFGNISSPLWTSAILWPPCKILRRSFQGNPSVGGVKRKRGIKIERFWTYRRLYLINGAR